MKLAHSSRFNGKARIAYELKQQEEKWAQDRIEEYLESEVSANPERTADNAETVATLQAARPGSSSEESIGEAWKTGAKEELAIMKSSHERFRRLFFPIMLAVMGGLILLMLIFLWL